ncbi:PREDICTED: anthrax toxin receptor-like isoform X2 [Populus euphratica]|uniref:Anthrax toxin receptor-like isoform X2 n=1 Tax=Populus euphratica TaxID=75702 RepID=A0AAJ6TGH0_POPEU|nr:PREDICTED: anthrax toxin receptor-like isoform X2 [Populus euphratica]
MAETKVTTMVIKVVDLGCEKCHKKIKRVLCDIPQIQNQTYDKKENTVTITVVCCCPEKIKKKIYCKGGPTVKCVEIKPPPAKNSKTDPEPKQKPEPEPKQKPEPKPKPCTCCEKSCSCRSRSGCDGCGDGCCSCRSRSGCDGCGDGCCSCRSRSGCDVWGDGCCSCRSRGYYVCRSAYVCEEYYPSAPCTIM